jgi:hypothetical protein
MSLCTDRTVVNEGYAEGTISTLKCKRWSCDQCQPMLRREVIDHGRNGLPNKMLTLTWNAARTETPEEAARVLKNAWVNLRRRMERELSITKVPFLAVFERTKRGYPHLHILLRCDYVDQAWISEQMKDMIDAPIVDIRSIENKKHYFFYATKYIGKELTAFQGCKRWWRSHNYEIEKEERAPMLLFGDRLVVEPVDFYTAKSRILKGAYNVLNERRGWLHYERAGQRRYVPERHRKFANELPEEKQSLRAIAGRVQSNRRIAPTSQAQKRSVSRAGRCLSPG